MSSPLIYTHHQQNDSLVARHKRRGVALSCAECRRLKLKCSRVFPCSNCVKKGCAAICPQGSLTTGKGNRFVLANTEVLHEKINQLANRVRSLEDALSESHSRYSEHRHPLLTDELLQIKRPLERERPDESVATQEEKIEQTDTVDSLGSLSISQDGRSTFFGTTANSWYLLQNEEGSDEDGESQSTQEHTIPADLSWLTSAFPFNTVGVKTAMEIRSTILGYLPDKTAAKKLSVLYFRHAAWMYNPITDLDFYETVFRPMYDQTVAPSEPISSHNLAVLFMVLALGSLLDLEAPAQSPQAMQYYQLGRASLALDSVLEEQSIAGIQALLLMCHFMFLAELASPRWVIMGMVVKMAHSVGLHRDSGKWKLDPKETHKRRELFYELLTYDSWQSLTFGRPPSLSPAHFDSRFPHETTINAQGDVEMSFAAWKHRFVALCLSVVHDQAFGARAPNYQAITDLDKKVRDFYIPPSLHIPGFGNCKIGVEVEQPSIELTMQRHIAWAIREITLFYMHRGFFAQALEDNPKDPVAGRYGQSVVAAYGSACTFVGLIESVFKQHPRLTERMWFLFTHVFSCSIVLGSLAVTGVPLASSALSYLDSTYNLFTRVSDNSRTQKILPILQNLRERARAAQSSEKSPVVPSDSSVRIPNARVKTEINELTTLGGMTRLVARRSSQSPSFASSPASQPASPPMTSIEAVSPVITYQTSPVEEMQPWAGYGMNPGYAMEVQEYSSYPSVHGVVQQINASTQHAQPHQMQPQHSHQPHQSHHQSQLSPLSPQQISMQSQIPHTHQSQQQSMHRQQHIPPQVRVTQHQRHQQQQHHTMLSQQPQQQQMSHHQSMSMQHTSPQTPQPPQPMYNDNHIQQLAAGVMPEFFGYGGGNDYTQMQMMPSPEVATPPQDVNLSWYNLYNRFQ